MNQGSGRAASSSSRVSAKPVISWSASWPSSAADTSHHTSSPGHLNLVVFSRYGKSSLHEYMTSSMLSRAQLQLPVRMLPLSW